MSEGQVRTARVYSIVNPRETPRQTLAMVNRYLPRNYTATLDGVFINIEGFDNSGWTLDGYVLPRLASGLIYAEETTA